MVRSLIDGHGSLTNGRFDSQREMRPVNAGANYNVYGRTVNLFPYLKYEFNIDKARVGNNFGKLFTSILLRV